MKKLLFLFILLSTVLSCAKHTESIVTGQVTDGDSGEPISGVEIQVWQKFIESDK